MSFLKRKPWYAVDPRVRAGERPVDADAVTVPKAEAEAEAEPEPKPKRRRKASPGR